MRTRWLGNLAAALVAVLPLAASAERPLQAPHDMTWSVASCDKCHSLYVTSPGGKADFTTGCQGCHNTLPAKKVSKGFPWFDYDKAVPGQQGSQHHWSAPAVNAALQVNSPPSTVVAQRLVDGNLQCTVCHDPHEPGGANTPSSFHVSIPVDQPQDNTVGSGLAQMTLQFVGTTVKAYRVQIASASTLVVSHDFALATPTWTAPITFALNTTVALDDPAVRIKITGAPQVGDYWDFYMSYPFVRVSNVADGFCLMCHTERNMTHVRASGSDPLYRPNGVRKFSHPVGVTLNANAKNYDYAPATMLDASGAAQTIGDGATTGDRNKSNNLRLDSNVVRCTTCHAVHNADSNSLSVDAR